MSDPRELLRKRPALTTEQARRIYYALEKTHVEIGKALAQLGHQGILGDVEFSADKGYLIVLLRTAVTLKEAE